MQPSAVELYKGCRDLHEKMYKLMVGEIETQVRATPDEKELLDFAYSIKESQALIDDLSSVMTRVQDLAIKMACMFWVHAGSGHNIETPYCTGAPNLKMTTAYPKRSRDPESFVRFMQALGIKPELYELEDVDGEPTEAVRPHWPGMLEYVSKLLSEGKPLPEGMDQSKAYTVYRIRIRKRKAVTEE